MKGTHSNYCFDGDNNFPYLISTASTVTALVAIDATNYFAFGGNMGSTKVFIGSYEVKGDVEGIKWQNSYQDSDNGL